MGKKEIKKIGKFATLLIVMGVFLSGCIDNGSDIKEDIDDRGEEEISDSDTVGTNERVDETIYTNITEDVGIAKDIGITEGTNITEDAKIAGSTNVTGEQYTDTNNTIEENIAENYANNETEQYTGTNGTIEENVAEDYVNNESEQTPGDDIIDNARIESDSAIVNSGGLEIRLRIYNDENNVNKSEGTIDVVIYEIEDSDEGPVKGNELDRWELQITNSDYGENSKLVKILEYHKSVTYSSRFVNVDYMFTTKDGQSFETSDEYIDLS